MKMISINIYTLCIFAIYLCHGQVLKSGDCPDVNTMEYFELERFVGKWYEIERYPMWYEGYGQCAYKNFEACGRLIEIEHSYVKDGIHFALHVNTTYAPGDDAIFEIPANNIDPLGVPMSVIFTDYTNYAIMYGCKWNDELHVKYVIAWILSRTETLELEILEKAREQFASTTRSSVIYFETVNQNSDACAYHWRADIQAVYTNSTLS